MSQKELEQVEGQEPSTTTEEVVQPFFYQPTPEEIVSYITSVKIQGNGWLVNGNMSVPNDDGNTHCQHVKLWISLGNTPEDEFTSDELEITRIAKIKAKAGEIINSRYPAFKQQNVALGLETKEYSDTMIAFIKNIKEQSSKLEKNKKKTSDDFIIGE